MNAKQKSKFETLQRRRTRLAERVKGYRKDGNVEAAKRELSALNWAIRVIENCESSGILKDVSS